MSGPEVDAIGVMLATLRGDRESSIVVGFGTYAGDHETPEGSVSATVTCGKHYATGSAVSLADALSLARAKLAREAEARAKAAARVRADAAEARV